MKWNVARSEVRGVKNVLRLPFRCEWEAPRMSDTSFDGQRITAGTELILSPASPLQPASLFTPTPEAERR